METTTDVVLQADKSAFKAKKIGINGGKNPGFKTGKDMSLETIDFNKKILHGSWHPRENTIAVCAFCYAKTDTADILHVDRLQLPTTYSW